jgi:hypothetical protein
MLIQSFVQIMRTSLDSESSIIGPKPSNITMEIHILLWHIIKCNKKFTQHLCSSPNVLDILYTLLLNSFRVSSDINRIGSLRLISSILHLLSQERTFGIALNAPVGASHIRAFSGNFASFTSGCWADILFLSLITILSLGGPTRSSILNLQESFLVILVNVSPFVKSLAAQTAIKLVNLFSIFIQPSVFLNRESNHKALILILYILNTILQYQYSGNPQVVYSLVRIRDKIDGFDKLDFETAAEQATNMRKSKGMNSNEKGKERIDCYESNTGFKASKDWV